jgi:hypothetical protein
VQLGTGVVMLEDRHIQLNQDKCLYDYDLILRTNDDKTKYVAFDIYDYKNNKTILTKKLED